MQHLCFAFSALLSSWCICFLVNNNLKTSFCCVSSVILSHVADYLFSKASLINDINSLQKKLKNCPNYIFLKYSKLVALWFCKYCVHELWDKSFSKKFILFLSKSSREEGRKEGRPLNKNKKLLTTTTGKKMKWAKRASRKNLKIQMFELKITKL